MTKRAFILLNRSINNIDGQSYLNACIKKITSEGYVVLIPHEYDLFQKEFNSIEYYTKICLVVNKIFMFTDFGWDKQMHKMARIVDVQVMRLNKNEKAGLWMLQRQGAEV